MKNKLFLSIFIMFSFDVFALEMQTASLCYNNENIKEQSALDAGKVISKLYKKESPNEASCIGWTNLGSGDIWYDVTSEPKVNVIDVKNEKLLNHWPLTSWPHHLFLAGEYTAAAEKGSNIRGESFTRPKDSLEAIKERTPIYSFNNFYQPAGCLKNTPLRYGDVDSDSQPELVLFIDNNIVVFSPQQGKVIFSYHYELNDELDSEEAKDIFLSPYLDTDPQYIAGSGTDNLVREIFPAQRSYSKIYIQDFNGDKKSDIVLWRKMYVSNLRNNPVQGFHKLAETWVHYQRNTTGEYLPQDTSPETIQNWLSAKNLTWQKGFPSKSECAGEEGKLIPEMHDPLLNDPDVLK